MHGGLPPPHAFPFATLGGDLVPEPADSAAAAAAPAEGATISAAAAEVSDGQLLRLEITKPALVGLAQQYIMTPKVSTWPAAPLVVVGWASFGVLVVVGWASSHCGWSGQLLCLKHVAAVYSGAGL